MDEQARWRVGNLVAGLFLALIPLAVGVVLQPVPLLSGIPPVGKGAILGAVVLLVALYAFIDRRVR